MRSMTYLRGAILASVVFGCLRPVPVQGQCDTITPPIPTDLDSVATFQYDPTGGTDCWGWTSPNGTHYAIYGAADGIAFINASALQQVAFFPTPTTCWSRDMQTYSHYCLVVSECGTGLQIYDLQYLPDSVTFVTAFLSGGTTCHNLAIDTARGFAYLVNPMRTGFRVLDIANPEAPVELPGVVTDDIHDVFARNDTVWVAEGSRHTFSCWDFTDKQNPSLLVRIGIPNSGYVHDAQWSPDGRLLATTEETVNKTIKLWNVQDLSNVSLISEFLGPNNYAHNAHFFGRYLFVSHYDAGVILYEISNPECPVVAAQYDTYPDGDLPLGFGCWGVFPYTGTSQLLYASNRDGRLFVFRHDTATVDIEASPRAGSAPLAVNFNGFTRGAAQSWSWDFGDGTGSAIEDPDHTFGPGLFDVSLSTSTTLGFHTEFEPHYITALAETLIVSDTVVPPGSDVVLDLDLRNHVPVTDMTIPILVGGLPYIVFDSVVTTDCRTSEFERKQVLYNLKSQGKYVIRLEADIGGGTPPMEPGDGPILRVYLSVNSGVPHGTVIPVTIEPINSFEMEMKTITMAFVPEVEAGAATVETPSANFAGSPVFGPAPLLVSFTSQSQNAVAWAWDFGDGGLNTLENPVHSYGVGVFDVSLQTNSGVGTATQVKSQYVTAYADTLIVRDTSADVGTSCVWDIIFTNHVPISELVMPILLSNVPSQAYLDSIVTTDGRMGYFESQQITYDRRAFGAMAFRLTADTGGGSPPLPPGTGAIARMYLSIKPVAVPGNQIVVYMPTLGSNVFRASTIGGDFAPALTGGEITLTGTQTCECDCHGDLNCDSATDIQDVVGTIGVAFRGDTVTIDTLCPHHGRTDVNCSGATDVIDVIKTVDVAFRGVDLQAVFCNPCD